MITETQTDITNQCTGTRKMMNWQSLIIVSILFIFLSGCKQSCSCDSYKTLPESTREWFMFGEGSWWIYRLAEDTTVFDTVVALQYTDHSSSKHCEPEIIHAIPCAEVLNIKFSHSNAKYFPKTIGDTIHPGMSEIMGFSPNFIEELLELRALKSGYIQGGPFLEFPLIKGENYNGIYTLIDTFSEITVNHLQINNTVAYTQYSSKGFPDDQITDIWWAKGIGLIKSIKKEGRWPKTTWELVSYSIKK